MKTGLPVRFATAVTVAVLLSGPVNAAAKCSHMNVAAAEIPYFVESPVKGQFVELLRAAAKRAELSLNIKLYPKKRALGLFQIGVVDVLMPHSSAGVDVPSYKSVPILNKRDFVFVRKGTPIPASIEELEGLRIGLTSQYAYPKSLTENKKIEFSRAPNTDLESIRMLSIGRFDGSIIEERSGLKAISEAGVADIVYDENNPINELNVWILFGESACGLEYRDKINAAFQAMIADGEWDTIKKLTAPNG